jgi:hypothetical protein
MTREAEFWDILRELEGIFSFLRVLCSHRLMATIAGFSNWVRVFGLQKPCMTLTGNAAFFRRQRCIEDNKTRRQNNKNNQ